MIPPWNICEKFFPDKTEDMDNQAGIFGRQRPNDRNRRQDGGGPTGQGQPVGEPVYVSLAGELRVIRPVFAVSVRRQ